MFDKDAGCVVNSANALAAARGIQKAKGSELWGAQESAMFDCRHITQSVGLQHVVVDCMIYKAPDGFAGLRRQDAATIGLGWKT